MTDVALRTVGLGKMYHIGGERQAYRTLRDTIAQAAKRPIERIRHPGAATHTSEELWALRDIDLEVRHGEALGIIGRNGAGKSTLLKVLSRITEPSEGRVEIAGRVSSLLDVGTGFHPELTGRENIQLNGAILGMTRAEIKRKFDEIVEFSEIGGFLDTPVKRYSSGMYVRLAFAVAAQLEPEILIVDEVLAVGDAGFQKRCLGKMEDVAGQGRTVLFVSHNMMAIRSLCTRAVELDAGRIINSGESSKVVVDYLARQAEAGAEAKWPAGERPGDDGVQLVSMQVVDSAGEVADLVATSRPFGVRIEVDLASVPEDLCIGFDLATGDGSLVLRSYQSDLGPRRWPKLTPGPNQLECTIPAGILNNGRYVVLPRVCIHNVRWIVHSEAAVSFEVHRDHVEADPDDARSPYAQIIRPGIIAPILDWNLVSGGAHA
jgi:lipopolysaccharide transport system ATP-binding protein